MFLAIGIGMLLNAPLYRAMGEQFLGSYALIYLSGLLALTAGIAHRAGAQCLDARTGG